MPSRKSMKSVAGEVEKASQLSQPTRASAHKNTQKEKNTKNENKEWIEIQGFWLHKIPLPTLKGFHTQKYINIDIDFLEAVREIPHSSETRRVSLNSKHIRIERFTPSISKDRKMNKTVMRIKFHIGIHQILIDSLGNFIRNCFFKNIDYIDRRSRNELLENILIRFGLRIRIGHSQFNEMSASTIIRANYCVRKFTAKDLRNLLPCFFHSRPMFPIEEEPPLPMKSLPIIEKEDVLDTVERLKITPF